MQLYSLPGCEVNAADVILADHLGYEGQLFRSDASGAAAQAQHIAFAVALGEAAEVTGKLLVGNFADFLVMIVGAVCPENSGRLLRRKSLSISGIVMTVAIPFLNC